MKAYYLIAIFSFKRRVDYVFVWFTTCPFNISTQTIVTFWFVMWVFSCSSCERIHLMHEGANPHDPHAQYS